MLLWKYEEQFLFEKKIKSWRNEVQFFIWKNINMGIEGKIEKREGDIERGAQRDW